VGGTYRGLGDHRYRAILQNFRWRSGKNFEKVGNTRGGENVSVG
jgi:hypothetical protein